MRMPKGHKRPHEIVIEAMLASKREDGSYPLMSAEEMNRLVNNGRVEDSKHVWYLRKFCRCNIATIKNAEGKFYQFISQTVEPVVVPTIEPVVVPTVEVDTNALLEAIVNPVVADEFAPSASETFETIDETEPIAVEAVVKTKRNRNRKR